MGSRKCSLVKSKDKAKEGYHDYGNNPKRLGGSKVMKTFHSRNGWRTFNVMDAAVKLMKTHITFLAQSKSMRSIIDVTHREQRHGSA